jgi:uncharacterized protein (DUF362 family)
MSKVAFVKTEDRRMGVKSSISTLGLNPVKNKDVLIKPNFNTADQKSMPFRDEVAHALLS